MMLRCLLSLFAFASFVLNGLAPGQERERIDRAAAELRAALARADS